MNEVAAMAEAGATLGTAMMTARQRAASAGRAGAKASRQAASRAASNARKRLAERDLDAAHVRQGMIQNLRWARHELAARLEPNGSKPSGPWVPGRPEQKARRWPWVLVIAAIGAVVATAAAVLASRSNHDEPGEPEESAEPEHPAVEQQVPRQQSREQPADGEPAKTAAGNRRVSTTTNPA